MGFGELLPQGRIVGSFLFEFPGKDRILFDNDRSFCSVDLDLLERSRIGCGGGFDHAERAVFESQRSHADIFDFDPFMGQRIGSAGDFDHVSH